MTPEEIQVHFEREFLRWVFELSARGEPDVQTPAEIVPTLSDDHFTGSSRKAILGALKALCDDGQKLTEPNAYDQLVRMEADVTTSEELFTLNSHLPDRWPAGGVTSIQSAAQWLIRQKNKRDKTEKLRQAHRQIQLDETDEARLTLDTLWDEDDLTRPMETATYRELAAAIMTEHLNPPDEPAGTRVRIEHLADEMPLLHEGCMTIVGGNPSDGKSAFMSFWSFVLGAWKTRSAIVSGEDSMETHTERLAQKLTGLSRYDPRKITNEMAVKLDKFWQAEASNCPMIVRPRGRTLEAFQQAIRVSVRRHHAQVVFVDYVQIMDCPGLSEYEQIKKAVNTCKDEAQRHRIHIVLGSQYNREGRNERKGEPSMQSFRGAGVIEEATENAICLWRTGEGKEAKRHMKLVKQKNGHVGQKWNLKWEEGRMCVGLEPFLDADTGRRMGAHDYRGGQYGGGYR